MTMESCSTCGSRYEPTRCAKCVAESERSAQRVLRSRYEAMAASHFALIDAIRDAMAYIAHPDQDGFTGNAELRNALLSALAFAEDNFKTTMC
jgi:hypothetical protein